MIFPIKNRTFEQILDFSISGMYRFCPRPTVKTVFFFTYVDVREKFVVRNNLLLNTHDIKIKIYLSGIRQAYNNAPVIYKIPIKINHPNAASSIDFSQPLTIP